MAVTDQTTVNVPLADLPDNCEVSGSAVKRVTSGGQKDESTYDDVVLNFRKKPLREVKAQLAEVTFDRVDITDLRFAE